MNVESFILSNQVLGFINKLIEEENTSLLKQLEQYQEWNELVKLSTEV